MKQQNEIKELIPSTIAPKAIRHLGIKLTKQVIHLYSENYKTLTREIEDYTQKTGKKKPSHAHGLENKYC